MKYVVEFLKFTSTFTLIITAALLVLYLTHGQIALAGTVLLG